MTPKVLSRVRTFATHHGHDAPTSTNPTALLDAVGTDLGTTDWITITQDQIDKFADATLDNQWIHVDTERAKAGPFGAPIAHGYLTMSLASHFLAELVRVDGISMGINYGADKVRFPAPVPVGSKLRGRGELIEAKEVPGGVQATTRITIERDGGDKPAAIVDTVSPVPRVTPATSGLDAFRLDGKVAIVTGAGRGIGAADRAHVRRGGRRRRARGAHEGTARRGRRRRPRPRPARARDPVRRQRQRRGRRHRRADVDEFGRLDIVVNNAGGTMPRPFLDTSPGFLERSFHFNVTTAFVLSKAAAPHMLDARRSGAIVNISSAIGRLRDRGFVAYGTAKAALTPHDAAHGRRPRAEGPGQRRSRSGRSRRPRSRSCSTDDEIHDEMVRRTPLKRLGQPGRHRAAARSTSRRPPASFVTGKLFEIDGGLEEANLEMGLPDL